jgi:hypothetical protein
MDAVTAAKSLSLGGSASWSLTGGTQTLFGAVDEAEAASDSLDPGRLAEQPSPAAGAIARDAAAASDAAVEDGIPAPLGALLVLGAEAGPNAEGAGTPSAGTWLRRAVPSAAAAAVAGGPGEPWSAGGREEGGSDGHGAMRSTPPAKGAIQGAAQAAGAGSPLQGALAELQVRARAYACGGGAAVRLECS